MAQPLATVAKGPPKSVRRGLLAGLLVFGFAAFGCAQAAEPTPTEQPTAQEPLPDVPESWARRASRDLARPTVTKQRYLAIVELPSEAAPGTRERPRRALSVPSEAPRLFLRSIGIEANECSTRLRLPTKLKRDAQTGTSLEVRAYLGLACSF